MTPRGLARIIEHDARGASLTTAQRDAVAASVARLRCEYGEMEPASELASTLARMVDLDRSDARSHGEQPSRVLECAYISSTLASMAPHLRPEAVDRAATALRPWTLAARQLGSRGGEAAAKAMSHEQRRDRARKAVAARWEKRRNERCSCGHLRLEHGRDGVCANSLRCLCLGFRGQ